MIEVSADAKRTKNDTKIKHDTEINNKQTTNGLLGKKQQNQKWYRNDAQKNKNDIKMIQKLIQ